MTEPVDADDKSLKFVPLATATVPPGGLIEHIANRWWVVHPERGVCYFVGASGKHASPQCNDDKSIVERLFGARYPWAEIRLIPSVFRRINPHDYC